MKSLLEAQREVGRGVIAGEVDGIAALMAPSAINPDEILSVYRSTYLGGLVRALRLNYPVVRQLVGEEFFEGAARLFITENPARSACLDDYGADFPAFLSGFEPAASLAYLGDVARLEWAVRMSLNAEDAEGLSLEALADVQGDVRFTAHPALTMMSADYPVDLIWRAVLDRDDAALRTIDPDSGAIHLLIEQSEGGVHLHRLQELEWKVIKALQEGQSLLEVMEISGPQTGALLGEHLAAGRFVAFHALESLP
jgi:hypothetical protein